MRINITRNDNHTGRLAQLPLFYLFSPSQLESVRRLVKQPRAPKASGFGAHNLLKLGGMIPSAQRSDTLE